MAAPTQPFGRTAVQLFPCGRQGDTRYMETRQLAASAETRLNDLQADVEAGSRLVDEIHHQAAHIRDALLMAKQGQASSMKVLMKQLAKLKACVLQQRRTMRELRHDVRALRTVSAAGIRATPLTT